MLGKYFEKTGASIKKEDTSMPFLKYVYMRGEILQTDLDKKTDGKEEPIVKSGKNK